MSDYGVELINDYGYRVASMEDVNYVLRSSGIIKNSHFPSVNNTYCVASMDVSGMNAPLVFFRSMSGPSRLAQIPGIGLQYPDFINGGRLLEDSWKTIDVYKWWNLDIGDVQYYIFDRWIPPERSDYGIQIFDQSGGIIFDSGWKFLKLRDVIWLDPGYPNHGNNGNGFNWTNVGSVGAGNLALSMPHPRGYIVPLKSFGMMMHECCHLDANNNIFVSILPNGEYLDMAPAQGWVDNMRTQVMVADVGGLPLTFNPVQIIRSQ